MDQQLQNANADRYRQMAEVRTLKVIRALRQLGILSRYQYTPKELEQIFAAIRLEVDTAERKFQPMFKLVD